MKIPKYIIPLMVVATLFSGYFLKSAFTKPTTVFTVVIPGDAEIESEKLICVVQGLKCKGTANFFTRLFKEVPGILSIETFASDHIAEFTYDPKMITPDDIKAVIEQQVNMKDGSQKQVFLLLSMK